MLVFSLLMDNWTMPVFYCEEVPDVVRHPMNICRG